MYLFQRLFINTLAESPECKDLPKRYHQVILGKNWGIFIRCTLFCDVSDLDVVYSTAITNDSASYLQTFGVTDSLLSENPFYGLIFNRALVAISSRGEQLLFKLSSFMVMTKNYWLLRH